MTKDYLIEVKVKNNLLVKKIRENGFDSVSAFARATGMTASSVGRYVLLKEPAIDRWGKWRKSVEKMAQVLKCLPEDLFPPQHIDKALKNSKASFEADINEVAGFLASNNDASKTALDYITSEEAQRQIANSFSDLTAREERILRLRYGFDSPEDLTYQQIGDQFGVQRERIRQLEAKALRKLKHPKRSKDLRDAADSLGFTPRFSNNPPPRHYVPQWKKDEEKQYEEKIIKALSDPKFGEAFRRHGAGSLQTPELVFEEETDVDAFK